MNIAVLEAQLQKEQTTARDRFAAITTTAEGENRDRTDAERVEVETLVAKANTTKAQLAKAKGDAAVLDTINALTHGHGTPQATAPTARGRRSMGQQFTSSTAYEDFIKKGLHRTSSSWRSPSVELFDHAIGTGMPGLMAATLTEDPASGGALVQPQYVPGIVPLAFKRLVVADLLAPGTTTSPVVNYMKEKTFVNAANSVAEGAAKPESTLTFEATSEPVRKIAHWLPSTEEMLEDVAQIQSYIDARLRLGVQIEEEDQLLNGTTTPPDIVGLMNRTGLAPDVALGAAPDTGIEAIFRQVMAIFASSFLMPDGIVINPADWAQVLLTKNGQGAYLTQGPFSPIQAPTLWGLPVVVTPSITVGTALVGAYRTAAQVFRHGGIRVEASNSHQDFFIKNLVAIRAEERLALAVYRPGAFGKVTGI